MNKKKKSTNISPYPDDVIDRLARAFYPAILACWNSEEGQREFAAWQAEQAHLAGKEKQEVPNGELPAVHTDIVCGFGRVRPGGRTLFLFCPQFSNPWLPATFFKYSSGSPFRIKAAYPRGSL